MTISNKQKPKVELSKSRLQKLAKIENKEPYAATITVKGKIIELKEVPSWYDILRYAICGFNPVIIDDKRNYENRNAYCK